MKVPANFHNGEWTSTDDWMEAHPKWTYLIASLLIYNIIGWLLAVIFFVFHP